MLELRGVSLRDEGGRPVLTDVTVSVSPGERVALMGANGSGKSTLLRIACALVPPASGDVLVDCKALSWSDVSSQDRVRCLVGRVGQDPDDQMVASTVFEEVAFGPCNLGLPVSEVRERTVCALKACHVSAYADRDVSTLSGGQRQRVALAGVVAMQPRYLLLDEPCSMLDAGARRDVLRSVDELAAGGCGIVHVTHSLDDVLGYDRVVVLANGHVAWEGAPRELVSDRRLRALACCLTSRWLDVAGTLLREGLLPAAAPLEDAFACAFQLDTRGALRARELLGHGRLPRAQGAFETSATLEAHELAYAYARGLRVLDGVSLEMRAGEVALVLGGTGSGKSTLLRLLAGLDTPAGGSICVRGGQAGREAVSPRLVGVSFQRAADQLFAQSVLDDVAFGPKNLGASEGEARARASRALARVGLDASEFGDRSPFALSGGQMRRVALAGILAMETPFVALDEPTVGLDAAGVRDLVTCVCDLAERGAGVIIVTHDPEVFADVASRAYVLTGGRVALSGSAADVLRDVEGLRAAGLDAPVASMFERGLDARGEGL